MAQRSGRQQALETFHQVVLTDDQLNTVAFALRTLQDQLEQERPNDVDAEGALNIIDQVMIQLDGLR